MATHALCRSLTANFGTEITACFPVVRQRALRTMSTLVAATASPTATPAAPVVSKSETVVPRPAAQFLLIQATTVSSSAAATTTSATPAPAPVAHSLTPHLPPVVPSLVPSIVPSSPTSSVLPASQSSLSPTQVPAPIIYSQRLPPGRLPHVQPPVLNQETRSESCTCTDHCQSLTHAFDSVCLFAGVAS